jgi:hypothetical protein
MSAHQGGSRRSRRSVARRPFRPEFDLLESRALPSGMVGTPLVPIPLPCFGPVQGDASSTAAAASPGVTVSTHCLKVTAGGNPASYTVVLNTQPTADVTVTLAQYDLFHPGDTTGSTPPAGDTPLTISPNVLTFTKDNWNTPQTVQVSAPVPPTATGTPPTPRFGEVVWVFGTTTSTDPNYEALAVPPVAVAVTNPIATPPGVVTSTDHLTLAPGASATYTIALATQPTADVTITINQISPVLDPLVPGKPGADDTTPPTPVGNGGPLTVTPTTLTFTKDNWNTPQTVTVAAPSDANGSGVGYGTFVLLTDTITSTDPDYNNLVVPPVAVNVKGSPAQGSVTLSTDHLTLERGGTSATFTVALTSKPTADVSITITQSSPVMDPGLDKVALGPAANDPLQISPTTLTFTSDNWNTAQTVTVGPPTSGSGNQFDILTLTAASSDTNYNNARLPSVSVVVFDNPADQPGLVYSAQKLEVTPGGAPASYTVALATKPTADVTVTISQADLLPPGSDATTTPPGRPTIALTITPTTLTFTPDNWNMPQTVQVSAPAPSTGGGTATLVEPPQQVLFLQSTLQSDDANYNGLSVPPVAVEVDQANPGTAGLVLSADRLHLTPGGAAGSYTIALATKPTADVTVTIAQAAVGLPPVPIALATDGSTPPIRLGSPTLTVTPTTLTFTPDDWNMPQTVQVSAPAPAAGSPPGTGVAWLVTTVTSSDTNYNNLIVEPVTVVVGTGDDGGPPVPLPPVLGSEPPGGSGGIVPVVVLPFIPVGPHQGAGTAGSHGGKATGANSGVPGASHHQVLSAQHGRHGRHGRRHHHH